MVESESDNLSDGEKTVSDSSTDAIRQAETATDNLSDDDGEWTLKAVAARRLRITERTLDRRIAQGKLVKRVGSDGSVEVFLKHQETPPDNMTDATRAMAVVERFNEALAKQTLPLVAQIREMAEEIGRLKAENEELRRRQKPWWKVW